MRPIKKWDIGHKTLEGKIVTSTYNPHTLANPLLQQNLDHFCNYCEIFSSDLEVEHIVATSKNDMLRTQWGNFLLACGRCNGKDNKSNKPVNLSFMYFPHINNTMMAFEYLEGGLVRIHPNLTNLNHQNKANALLDLVGLDKYPGNNKYPNATTRLHPNDKRWEHRRTAWENAVRKLSEYNVGKITAETVAKFAHQRGFFSVWFTVFKEHKDVKVALVNIFRGTAMDSFDDDFNPIPRNPTNHIDSI